MKKLSRSKKSLLQENEYASWEDFINDQKMGDCQPIVSAIIRMNISGVKKQFGEIRVEIPIHEDDFDKIMTHHWVLIDDEIFDFSKGSLMLHADVDLYSVDEDGSVSYGHSLQIST